MNVSKALVFNMISIKQIAENIKKDIKYAHREMKFSARMHDYADVCKYQGVILGLEQALAKINQEEQHKRKEN